MNYALNKKNYQMLVIDYSERNSNYYAKERSQLENDENIFCSLLLSKISKRI